MLRQFSSDRLLKEDGGDTKRRFYRSPQPSAATNDPRSIITTITDFQNFRKLLTRVPNGCIDKIIMNKNERK